MSGVSFSSITLWGEYGCYCIRGLFRVPIARFGSREGTHGMSTIPEKRIEILNRVVQLVPESYVSQEHKKSIVVGSERGTKTLRNGLQQDRRRFNAKLRSPCC
jgi:hypothetical protein